MTQRMLVPDAARGLALLGIAMANSSTAWFTSNEVEPADYFGGAYTPADKAAVLLSAVTAHVRGLPMFSTLLGFGVGLIAMSLWRRGFTLPQARRVLWRRYGLLALFGALHGLLLFYGDIMFAYGMLACLLTLMVGMSNKMLKIIAYVMLAASVLFGSAGIAGGVYAGDEIAAEMIPVMDAASYSEMLRYNVGHFVESLMMLPFMVFSLGSLMLIGFVWAREGTLADVPSHRRELIVWAVLGVVVALACGVPWGLSAIGVLSTGAEIPLTMANYAFGYLTGPAILAGLALVLQPLQERIWAGERTPAWLAAPVALGKRSMSGYLFQSMLFALVAYPFCFGLDLDAFGMLVVSFFIWVASLAAAWALEMVGRPGPFEWLHRRLSYGPTGRAELPTPAAASPTHA